MTHQRQSHRQSRRDFCALAFLHGVGERLRRNEIGQTTAEYALVLLAAGTIAMLAVAWAQNNGSIGGLFDSILNKITSLIE